MKRDNIYYYIRHIPNDLVNFYSVKRLCFSLKTKSNSTALRYAKSVTQRLDDYWFGIRLPILYFYHLCTQPKFHILFLKKRIYLCHL